VHDYEAVSAVVTPGAMGAVGLMGGGMLQKLRRETLAERAAASVMDYIQARDLKPGALLPSETSLMTQLGVSRAVIREAVKSLQGQGVVDVINGKGAVVRAIDPTTLHTFFARAMRIQRKTILELMEVRRGLEVECAILAATRRTAEDVAQLERTAAAMRLRIGDLEAYGDLDVALHLSIAAASHNDMLYHLVASLRTALQDTIREGLRLPRTDAQRDHMQVTHETLVEAVRRGDAEEAGRVMAVHLGGAAAALALSAAAEGGVAERDEARDTASDAYEAVV